MNLESGEGGGRPENQSDPYHNYYPYPRVYMTHE